MKKKKKYIYLIGSPDCWGLDKYDNEEYAGHEILQLNGEVYIWPSVFDVKHVNPENLDRLKNKYSFERLLIFDIIKGFKGILLISDHINSSGYNFLIGNTPTGERPRFPDISAIYSTVPGYETQPVRTVGPERFDKTEQTNEVLSIGIGLVAPVAAYLGLEICAFGVSNPEKPVLLRICSSKR